MYGPREEKTGVGWVGLGGFGLGEVEWGGVRCGCREGRGKNGIIGTVVHRGKYPTCNNKKRTHIFNFPSQPNYHDTYY